MKTRFFHIFIILLSIILYQGCDNENQSAFINSVINSTTLEEENIIKNTLRDEWFGFYFKGMKIGYLNSRISETETGYIGYSEGYMKVENIAGIGEETKIVEKLDLDKKYRLNAFFYEIKQGENSIKLKGEKNDNILKVILEAGGSVREKKEKIAGNIYSPLSLYLQLLKEGITAEKELSYDVYFQPTNKIATLYAKVGEAREIEFKGQKIRAYPVSEEIEGMKSTFWITEDGKKVKEESFEGFEIVAETKEEALKNAAKVNIFDMLRLAGIKTDIKIKNPSKTVRCELNFQGLKNDADIPERDRQRIKKVENLSSNGTKNVIIEIRKESLDNFKALPLPITFYKNYQKATQFIQSDSREIKNIAKEISKLSGNDSLLFVKETLKWFSKNIKESMVENFSALDTLKKGEGECQSHSYLFSAIMRAGNIPCRIVSGLVYPDGYNAFMYHSWCEVYLGKWVSVDPSLKQFPADSTHLVLAEGDIFSQAKIANFMRNSGIKVLKIQYD